MASAPDLRDHPRFHHEAAIMYEYSPSWKFGEGRMCNYSRGGLYFESDFSLDIGLEIFIGIENSPFSAGHAVYRAKVIWRRELPERDSYYRYGIGVKYF